MCLRMHENLCLCFCIPVYISVNVPARILGVRRTKRNEECVTERMPRHYAPAGRDDEASDKSLRQRKPPSLHPARRKKWITGKVLHHRVYLDHRNVRSHPVACGGASRSYSHIGTRAKP